MGTFDEIRRNAIEKATKPDLTLIPHRGKPGTFVPAGRPQRKGGFYLIDGEDFPSVTTILGIINKPALMKWAAKQAAKAVLSDPVQYDTPESAAAAIYTLKDDAAERGKEAHKIAEDYAKSLARGDIDRFTSDNPYFSAIRAFFNEMRPEVVAVEVVLVNKTFGYAGTADLIAKFGDRLFIVDWKTSKFVYDEMPLQIEAYRNAEFGITEDGSRFDALAPTGLMAEAGAVVLLRDNGTYLWSPVSAPLDAFLAAKRLWLWKQSLNGD